MAVSYVLVLNCGSSSIKFAVINPDSGENQLSGLVECVGLDTGKINWRVKGEKQQKLLGKVDYDHAIEEIIALIRQTDDLFDHIIAVGHRVVHGGELFTESALIDEKVLKTIRACNALAPLHNPANVLGIETAQKIFPKLPQVAVFDTAFHQTMPDYAYIYPIPYKYYKEYAIRRYGFHGTSHLFVTRQAAKQLNKPYDQCAFVSAHLGNGCSATAVLNGKSIDTTMGLTPLEGLMMGTRSGDVDPSLHEYLASKLGCDVYEITRILNKQSGLLGVSGQTSDMRGIDEAMEKGDKQAKLAKETFCYRLAKTIGALAVPLGRCDALIFTGGIGENDTIVRTKVIQWLKILDFELDEARNNARGRESNGIITKEGSTIAMVVPTNEELVIAQDAARLTL